MAQTISDSSSAWSRSSVASTLPHLRKMISDNVTDSTPLLSYLMGSLGGQNRSMPGQVDNLGNGIPGVIVGGRDIHVPVQLKENETVGAYQGMDPLDITHQDTDEYALFPIRQIAGSLVIAGRDMRANKGEAQIYSLLQGKVDRLVADMRMDVNRQAISDGTGAGGKELGGLAAIVATGTLGGISPTTYPKWQPGGFASGHGRHAIVAVGGAITAANMRKQLNRLTFGSDGPDAIFCSRNVHEFYADLIDGNIRYTSVAVGDADFKVLEFQGVRVFFDHAFSDGFMYFLNSKHLKFVRDSAADFEWIDEGQRPVDQDSFVKTMIVEGNLVTDNRRMLGVMNTITS